MITLTITFEETKEGDGIGMSIRMRSNAESSTDMEKGFAKAAAQSVAAMAQGAVQKFTEIDPENKSTFVSRSNIPL